MEEKEGKIIDNKIFFAYRKDIPQEEVNLMEGIIKKAIKESEKPRCKACVPCPMGVTGCKWDDVPHGHGCAETCPECGVSYYHTHPHSNTCSKATPITEDVRHDEHNMKRQLKESEMQKRWNERNKENKNGGMSTLWPRNENGKIL